MRYRLFIIAPKASKLNTSRMNKAIVFSIKRKNDIRLGAAGASAVVGALVATLAWVGAAVDPVTVGANVPVMGESDGAEDGIIVGVGDLVELSTVGCSVDVGAKEGAADGVSVAFPVELPSSSNRPSVVEKEVAGGSSILAPIGIPNDSSRQTMTALFILLVL